MKHILILAASLLMLGSCTPEEIPTITGPIAEIEPPTVITDQTTDGVFLPIENPKLPEWLIGGYVSRFYPESEVSAITADQITLLLNANFGAPDFYLLTSEITITENPDFVEVSYLNEFVLQFWKSDDPASTDIKIVYINNTGQVFQYGWFKKI